MNYWALTSRDSDSVGLGISGHGKTLQVMWCVTTITNITWAIGQCRETNLLQSAQPLRIWPLLCLLYRWGNWSPGEFMDTHGHKWVGSRAWMNAGDPSSFNILDGEVRAPLFPLGPFPKGKILSLTEMQAKDWQETPRVRVFESICFISISIYLEPTFLQTPWKIQPFCAIWELEDTWETEHLVTGVETAWLSHLISKTAAREGDTCRPPWHQDAIHIYERG